MDAPSLSIIAMAAATKQRKIANPKSQKPKYSKGAPQSLPKPVSPGLAGSPAATWYQFLWNSAGSSYGLYTTMCFGYLVKLMVSLSDYSGQGKPPMFGDFEAQRHWAEITTHLPLKEWYRYDLNYWGLDYPPLSAYHAWVVGRIGHFFRPEWMALDASRGFESPELKLYMRLTVIASELLIFAPALFLFARTRHFSGPWYKSYTLMLLTLLQPALNIIDHGHFQYNSVMLGNALFGLAWFLAGQYHLGAFFFVLSLGFKQMALYYILPVFFWLLGKCFDEGGIVLFLKLAISTLAGFYITLRPFAHPDDLIQVLHRVFPIARGLYEDKVANVWCALNVVVKLRELFDQNTLVAISAAATFIAVLPTCIALIRRPTPIRLVYGLTAGALAFFLFSFQVHEKSILLPLLPATLLLFEEPSAAIWFNNVAMFSLYPLLKKDGLQLPYVALTALWNVLAWYRPTLNSSQWLIWASYGVMAVWHLAELYIPAPERLPDVYPVLNAIYSCTLFVGFFVYYTVRVWTLKEGSTHRLKRD